MKTPTFDLQPMSAGDILDRMLRLYRRHFLHILMIVSLPYVLIIPLEAVLGTGLAGGNPVLMRRNPVIIAGTMFLSLLYVYTYFLSMAALARSVSERFLGGTPTMWTAYSPVLRRSLSLIWVYFLVSFAGTGIMVGAMVPFGGAIAVVKQSPTTVGYVSAAVLSIPTIVLIALAVRFFFRSLLLTQVVVIEDIRGWAAFKRSSQLMRANSGKAVLIFLFGLVVGVITLFLFNFPVGMLMALGPGRTTFVLGKVVGSFGQILSAPFGMIAFTLLYYDSRIRQEAFDLDMMAQNLGLSTSPAPPSAATTPSRPAPPRPATATPSQARPTGPPRSFGAFKVCPKCGAQVPNIQPNCGKCGTRVPFGPATG